MAQYFSALSVKIGPIQRALSPCVGIAIQWVAFVTQVGKLIK